MKDRYDFFLSGPIGNVANYKERFAEAERILHDVFGWYVRIWNPALLPPGKNRSLKTRNGGAMVRAILAGLGCVAAGFAYGAALCGATERWPDRMLALARWAGEVALPVLAVVAAVLVLACLAVSALCGGDDDEDGGER